jgi:hypothetical protein
MPAAAENRKAPKSGKVRVAVVFMSKRKNAWTYP